MALLSSRIKEVKDLLAALEAEKAGQSLNGNRYTNEGNGFQNISGSKINNGAHAGDGNSNHFIHNNGLGPTLNNTGNFRGNGNGGYYGGNFDSSTTNWNTHRWW